METKRCSKCGEVKAVDAFHRHSKMKDGRQTYCKLCAYAIKAAWRDANPEKERASTNARHALNPEKNNVRVRAYYFRNHQAQRQRNKLWVKANAYSVNESHRNSLSYARTLLVGRNSEFDLLPELIEAKRAHLQMVRILKKEKQK